MGIASSIASVVGVKTTATPVTAGLGEFVPGGDPSKNESKNLQAFQYFPETINDNRAPNYAVRPIPGGSHPIYTFIDGGERSISFSAIFTHDAAPEGEDSFASKALGLLTGTKSISLLGKKDRKDTVDIAAAIAWLRRFTYPTYGEGAAKAPPACVVYLPKSGIIGAGGFEDSIVAIMTACNVTYEAFHRDGTPRIAVVALEFKEIVQTDKAWVFYDADEFADLSNSYRRSMTE